MRHRKLEVTPTWAGLIMPAITTAGLLILWGSSPVVANEVRLSASPKAGMFLYAVPELPDSNFLHTVVLLVSYDEAGAMGFIINRPTDIPVDQVLPDMEGRDKLSRPLYFGGPVSRDQIYVILRTYKKHEGAVKVFDDVFFSWSLEVLAEGLKQKEPDKDLRIYSGYSGWGPGQLDREIKRGDWVIAKADREKVFSENPDSVWPEIFKIREKIEVYQRNPSWVPVSFVVTPF